MSTASTVKIQKKNWLTYQFFDVNGVNGSIREPSNNAFEVFLRHIHVFSDVNGVNGKVEKKNWDVNNFFDVNGVNGKNTEKFFADISIF